MANPQKENGHLDLANKIVEQLAQTQLSGYEIRLLWAILRKTYCWHKKQDWISYSQFREVTKIGNNSHISRGLKKLVLRQIVTKNGNKYGLNKDYDKWIKLPKLVIELPKLDGKLPKLAHTKETIQKKLMTKENNLKVSKNIFYGNEDINSIIFFLQEKLGGTLDDTQKQNRHFAYLLINKMKKDYPDKEPTNLIKTLIKAGLQDDFHSKNITNFKYLYYHTQKIIQSIKNKIKKGSKLIEI